MGLYKNKHFPQLGIFRHFVPQNAKLQNKYTIGTYTSKIEEALILLAWISCSNGNADPIMVNVVDVQYGGKKTNPCDIYTITIV